MINAKSTAYPATCGVILRAKTTSLKVTAFDVPVSIPLNGNINKIPTNAPSKASTGQGCVVNALDQTRTSVARARHRISMDRVLRIQA